MIIKELKEYIKDLPDEAPVFRADDENGPTPAQAYPIHCRFDDKWKLWTIQRKSKNSVQGIILE